MNNENNYKNEEKQKNTKDIDLGKNNKANTVENKIKNSDNKDSLYSNRKSSNKTENHDCKSSDTKENSTTTELISNDNNVKTKTEDTMKTKQSKGNKTAKIIISSSIAALILAGGVYCAYVGSYDRIMPNTYVQNTKISGMTQSEAAAELIKVYDKSKFEGKVLNLHCEGDTSSINIDNLSFQYETDKMTTDAYLMGRNDKNYFNKLRNFTTSLFTKTELAPVISYDEQALIGAINDLCKPHEIEPLGYTFRIGDANNIIIEKPHDGVKVDMEAAVTSVINEIFANRFDDVSFQPITAKAPPIDIDAFYNYITKPAEDAYYAKDENNNIYVVPGKQQVVVNKSDIENAVNQSQQTYTLPVQLVNPAIDSAFLQSILYEDTLGTYTTSYGGSSAARSSNIKVCSNKINGLELLPGEKFDFNKVVGRRTAAAGYQKAPVFVVREGKTVSEEDYGGGICQVSSTIYCAVSRTKLKVINRVSHSKDVTYVPKGMDATVSWGGPEFIFENSTDYPIRILAEAGNGIITVKIVGSSVAKPKVSLNVENDGDSVVVTKTTTDLNGVTSNEIISSKTPPTNIPIPEPNQTDMLGG